MGGSTRNYSYLFSESDDEKFISMCSDYLNKSAHNIRKISAEEYVNTCRQVWQECEIDEVFTFKILIDTNIYTGNDEQYEKMGLERHDSDPIPEDLYCTAVGAIDENGKYLGAPKGYDPAPKNPKSKRGCVVLGPSPYQHNEPDEPQIKEHIVAFFDILGFENTFKEYGLAEMFKKYQSLIDIALKPFAEKNLWTKSLTKIDHNAYIPGMYQFPIRYAYFSDSLLLWIDKDAALFSEFLGRCAKVFCSALYLGIPLRGAISVGKQILHNKTNTYLGAPLIEAARLEAAQDWVGLSLGVSFTSSENSLPIDPSYVRIYNAPVKQAKQELLSGLVLDWVKIWQEMYDESPIEVLEGIKKEGFEKYYDNAIKYINTVMNEPEWFNNIDTNTNEDTKS
jgi:hypothetical protein